MELIENLVLIVHMLSALAVVGLILMQQGKGAEAGSGFGAGSAGTVFGSSGAGNFLTKTTAIIAIVFFLTSFSLAYFAKQKSEASKDLGVPQLITEEGALPDLENAIELPATEPGYSEIPEFEGSSDTSDSEVPED